MFGVAAFGEHNIKLLLFSVGAATTAIDGLRPASPMRYIQPTQVHNKQWCEADTGGGLQVNLKQPRPSKDHESKVRRANNR